MKKSLPLLIVALTLAIGGSIGSYLARAPVKSRIVSFQVEAGVIAYGILTVPSWCSLQAGDKSDGSTVKPPVVFLLPGIISLADRFEGMAGELGRRGYASLALYFPSDNTRMRLKTLRAAARYIEESYPQLDSSRRAYFGHSLGGTSAVDAAYFDDKAYAAVSVGYYIGGELAGSPKNLLIGTGIYDDLNDRQKMRNSMRSITEGRIAREGILEGSFAERTARELFLSPYSNHASEKEDIYVIRRLLEWLDLSFYQKKAPDYMLSYHIRTLSVFSAAAGFFILLCAAGIALRRRSAPIFGSLWVIAYISGAAMLARYPACPLFWIRASFVIPLSLIFIMYFSQKEKKGETQPDGLEAFSASFISFSGSLIICALAFSLSQFIFNLPILLEDRHFLYAFPSYLFFTFFITGCSYIDAFLSWTRHFLPAIWIGLFSIATILMIFEFLRPGRILAYIVAELEKARSFMKFQKTPHIPPRQKAALAVLVLLVVASWFSLYRAGILSVEILKVYGAFILRYAALPLAFWSLGLLLVGKLAAPRRK
jgi:hypothetical protein